MMTTDKIGLYVHIPFCIKKCNYCDFCSYPKKFDEAADKYIDAVIREAEKYRKGGYCVDTLYIGGGTPSLLSPEQLKRLLLGLKRVFIFDEGFEFTVEANPGTVTQEKAISYRKIGVNRISLGVQSIHDNELKALGRIHSYRDFIDAFRILRDTGFDNINLDIMYAIPEGTEESLKKTLDRIIELSPDHISVYSLIVEEGTPFYNKRESLTLPDEESELRMYRLITDTMRAAGYLHYEISNYAKPTYESRHNQKYWKCEHYIGLGVSAHSYIDRVRFSNPQLLDEYIDGIFERECTELSTYDLKFEYAMMHLRLRDGFSLSEYKELFGEDFIESRKERIQEFADLGYLSVSDNRIAITESGFYVSNYIMSEIL